MKVLCNFSRSSYQQKPKGEQVKLVQSELSQPAEIELETLANLLVNGCNFRPAAVKGMSDSGFISQQIYGLDFDNTEDESVITPEDAIIQAKKKGINPAFVYSTFSNSEEKPKFRMIFLLNSPISDLNERNRVQNGLMKHFEKYIDVKCSNPARVFYGSQSKKLLYADFEAILTKESVLNGISEEITPARQPPKPKAKQKRPARTQKTLSASGNIGAIQNHDTDFLKKALKTTKKRVFDNRKDFLNYLYKEISLAELLGVEEKKTFCCILPEHEDMNPSANVFKEKFGTWRYKCFSCGANLNTKQIVEKLGNFSSEYQAIEFIKKIYNLEIKETAWSEEQKQNIDSILESLCGVDGESSFSSLCPTANANTRNAQQVFIQILLIAKSAIFPDRAGRNDGNIIFYMSDSQLMRASGKGSKSQIHRYLKLLAYHGMIVPVDDKEVPKAFLSKALSQRTAAEHKHISFYKIPSWVFDRTRLIETQGQKWKENGYRVKSISYEMFYRAEGAEVAGELFPQYKTITTTAGKTIQRKTSKKSDKLYSEVQEIVCDLIKCQGYCTEKQIIEIMCANGIGKEKADYRLKQFMPDLITCNCLKKCRCNKELKRRFAIETAVNSYPTIIFPED